MATIIAEKNGRRRTFNTVSWGLLGADKNGWVPLPDQLIEDVGIVLKEKPKTGQKIFSPGKDQKIENIKPADAITQAITNSISKTDEDDRDHSNGNGPLADDEIKRSENKLAFEKAAIGITKGAIKDFLDTRTPPVQYDKTAGKPDLVIALGEHMNFDIVEFQKMFS